MKQPSKRPSNLSDSVQRHLNAYAIAASAAGMGMLASAQPAEAKIIYTKSHHLIGANGQLNLDLNHDGIADFIIAETGSRSRNRLSVKQPLRNAVEGSRRIGWSSAAALKQGARIGAWQSFVAGTESIGVIMVSLGCTSATCWTAGRWDNVTNRYLGLKFEVHGKAHYGWARLTVRVPGFALPFHYSITGTLTGYAYETIPNKLIIAGKTKGPDVITMQPATLGRLAQGSVGLPVRHPRK